MIKIYGGVLVYLSKFITRRRLLSHYWFCELNSLWFWTIITLATVTNRQTANVSIKFWVSQSLKPRTGLYHLKVSSEILVIPQSPFEFVGRRFGEMTLVTLIWLSFDSDSFLSLPALLRAIVLNYRRL